MMMSFFCGDSYLSYYFVSESVVKQKSFCAGLLMESNAREDNSIKMVLSPVLIGSIVKRNKINE